MTWKQLCRDWWLRRCVIGSPLIISLHIHPSVRQSIQSAVWVRNHSALTRIPLKHLLEWDWLLRSLWFNKNLPIVPSASLSICQVFGVTPPWNCKCAMLTLWLPRNGINKCLRRIGFGAALSTSKKLPARVHALQWILSISFLIHALQWILSNPSIHWLEHVGPLHCKQDKVTSFSSDPSYPSAQSCSLSPARFPKEPPRSPASGDRVVVSSFNPHWFQLWRIGVVRSMLNSMQTIIPPEVQKFHWRQDKLLRTWIMEEHLPQKFTSKRALQTNPGEKCIYTPMS